MPLLAQRSFAMPASGQELTWHFDAVTSTLPSTADMQWSDGYVREAPQADVLPGLKRASKTATAEDKKPRDDARSSWIQEEG